MRYILSRDGRKSLAELSRRSLLLAFDYDGTLSPIVMNPEQAEMRQSTRALLAELAALYPCAVISGRARADVVSRLDGVALRAVVGNHGAEPSPGACLSVQVRHWRSRLEPTLASLQGVEIEDKHLSLSLHYRRADDKDHARGTILHAARLLEDARIIRGKQVVNVLPCGAPHKGAALQAIRVEERCETAIYVGDDDTDEDVFTLPDRSEVCGVRVGARRASAAEFYVRNQLDVDRFMEALVLCRTDEPRTALIP